jgi:hypothetical protein
VNLSSPLFDSELLFWVFAFHNAADEAIGNIVNFCLQAIWAIELVRTLLNSATLHDKLQDMDIIDKQFVGFAAQVATESPSVMNRINPKLVPSDVSDAVPSKLEFWRDPYMNLLDRCSLKGQVLKSA